MGRVQKARNGVTKVLGGGNMLHRKGDRKVQMLSQIRSANSRRMEYGHRAYMRLQMYSIYQVYRDHSLQSSHAFQRPRMAIISGLAVRQSKQINFPKATSHLVP